ncbi:MAG: DMT family transporter [Verrucomicrobiota bacterium]
MKLFTPGLTPSADRDIMNIGVFYSLLSAFLWSTTFVCARYLMVNQLVDPLTLALIRFALGAFMLLIFGLRCRHKALTLPRGRDLGTMAILALFGIGGMSVLLFFGQQRTTAINSSLLMQLNPVFILFLGLFIGERFSLINLAGILVSMVGALLVVGILTPHGLQVSWCQNAGDLLVLGAGLCWAIYSVFSKSTTNRLGGYAATTWVMLLGAAELALAWLIAPGHCIWPRGWLAWSLILYMAIFPTALAFFAWYEALRLIDLSLLNVMQYLTPAFTIVLAWGLLGERIFLTNAVGIGIVLAGVALIGFRQKTE